MFSFHIKINARYLLLEKLWYNLDIIFKYGREVYMTSSLSGNMEITKVEELSNICNNILNSELKNGLIHEIKEDIIDLVKDISIIELELLSSNIFDYAFLTSKKVRKNDISHYIFHKNNCFYDRLSEEQKEDLSSFNDLAFYTEISIKYTKLIKKILLDGSKSEMKESGYRKLDSLGRATIPVEYREKYDFEEGCKVDFIPTEDGLLLKRVYNQCIFCGTRKALVEYREKKVCPDCRRDLNGK